MMTPFIGEVVLYAFNFPPQGWAPCSGQLMPISQNVALFSLIGNNFGGDGRTDFALPDYRSLAPQGLQYCIALAGVNPMDSRPSKVAEIAILPYKTSASWLQCNGRLLQIAQSKSLFQVLGTSFGGDGQTSFGLPNLTSVVPSFPQSGFGKPQPKKVSRPGPTQSIYCICAQGTSVSEAPFLAEVRMFPTMAVPSGWSNCNGQLLPINRNQALFALLGLTFGGDGLRTFALPNLRSVRLPSRLQYYIAVAAGPPTRH